VNSRLQRILKSHRLWAVLSGLLLTIGYPKWDQGWTAWIALIPLLVALRNSTPARSFLLGWSTGMVFFTFTLSWVTESMHRYGHLPLWASTFFLLLLAAVLALYIGLFGWLTRWLSLRTGFPMILWSPTVWVTVEMVRAHLFTGFPWALLGYTQYREIPIIQISDLTGVYGVSFLIVLANAAAADFIRSRGREWKGGVVAASIITLVVLYGQWRLSTFDSPVGTLKIGLVQGNVDQGRKWDPEYREEIFGRHTRLTRDAAAAGAELVVWPEAATPFLFERDLHFRLRLEALARESGVSLLFGSPSIQLSPDNPKRPFLLNSAYLLSKRAELVGRYDKLHLVPFGEYVPLGRLLFFVEKMVDGIGDFIPGHDYTVLDWPQAGFGVVICYEVIFPDLVRRFVGGGAQFMATITNDAWFGRTAAAYQHFSMVTLRAVENRVAFVRAANTGISGVIEPSGRIRSATDLFIETVLVEAIPVGSPAAEKTFYTRWGDLFSYGCVILIVFGCGIAIKRKGTNHV
jgi:apolipoprotein N-acyltransferase